MTRGGSRSKSGRHYASVRFGQGERLEFKIPSARTEEDALERSRVMAEVAELLVSAGRRDLVRPTVRQIAEAGTPARLAKVRAAAEAIANGAIKAGHAKDITFRQWGDRYTSGELSKLWPDHVKRKDWSDDASRLKRYVYPLVGNVPVRAFTFETASLVLSKLPEDRVRREATRRHIAQIMGRLMHLAVFPGRLIPATPLPKGWLPKITDRRMYSCLYPREEAMLLGHAATPEVFRIFCGVLNREGMRLTELLDSTWAQWNLVEGTFRVAKSKTGDPRFWAIRPDVAEAMRLWKRELAGDDDEPAPFAGLEDAIGISDRTKLADAFRLALQAAGVSRSELFETTEHVGKLRAHDMRATFVTTAIAAGRTTEWIRDRTAHKSTAMIDRYRRTARQFAELELGDLLDLPSALGWRKAGGKAADFGGSGGEVSIEKYRRRDSNPHALRAADFESPHASPESPDQLEIPAERDVAELAETVFRHLSATLSAPIDDGAGGSSAAPDEASTGGRPAPAKVRLEVDGAVAAEAQGGPKKLARAVARGLRSAGLPAVSDVKRVRVGGRS